VSVRELAGFTSQRDVGARNLSGATHGAGRRLELIGIGRVDAGEVVTGACAGNTCARAGNTRVGVGVGMFVGDARVDFLRGSKTFF
jgi:hypothetical protein